MPQIVTAEGYLIRQVERGTPPYPFLRNAFEVVDPADGRVLLTFEAYMAKPAGPGEIVVATTPENESTNIFIVSLATGQATFIATSWYTAPNWPLAANRDLVVWTEDYCGAPPGRTRVFDRRTDTLTELDRTDWVELTPGGLIGDSRHGFGARALIDPRTWSYVITLPDGTDVVWSPDYRYASRGLILGHGRLCGG